MSILLIPIAPLSRTKSRLRDCFPKELLKELTVAMFKDLASKVVNVDCFDQKIVYCHNNEILELAEGYGLIGIKEKLTKPRKSKELLKKEGIKFDENDRIDFKNYLWDPWMMLQQY